MVGVGCCWSLLVVVGCCWLLLVVVGCCWLLLVSVGCGCLLLLVVGCCSVFSHVSVLSLALVLARFGWLLTVFGLLGAFLGPLRFFLCPWSAWGPGASRCSSAFPRVLRHEVAADHLRAVPTLHGAAGRGRRERRLLGARGAAQALGALLRRPGGEHALQEGCPAAAAAWLSRLRALLRGAPRRPLINTCTKNFFACGAWRQPTNL